MFLDSLDIGNRALQHVGEGRIADVDEDTRINTEVSFAYDKVRRAELRRNVWCFAVRTAILRAIDTDTMLLVPRAWDNDVTYLRGAVTADANGILWVSKVSSNVGNEPGRTAAWEQYFGPMTVSLYDSETSYYTGELVYKETGDPGSYVVFMSLQSENEDVPGTATAWVVTETYHRDDVVSSGGFQWRSLIEVNTGITPAAGPLAWDTTAIYDAADTVVASDGYIYSSVAGSNTGYDPVTDEGVHWTNTQVANAWAKLPGLFPSSIKWLPLFAAVERMNLMYPIGTGPASSTSSRNVYHKPAGFLRKANQNPSAGFAPALGGPANLPFSDWELEGKFIISSEATVLRVRFVADIVTVTEMDDMFCEGFAARIALAVCEPLTQSGAKLGEIAAVYRQFMSEARLVNAIEIGPEDPPEDDYITCRQ